MSSPSKPRKQRRVAARGITAIAVRGYKSLAEECSIAVRPLTLLAGANSSGKSSIMQPLLLLKQTLEASYDPGALLLDGPNVRFTSAEQFLSRFAKKTISDTFTIQLEIDGDQCLVNTFTKQPNKGIELVEMVQGDRKQSIVLRPDMPYEAIMAALPRKVIDLSEDGLEWRVRRIRCFLTLQFWVTEKAGGPLLVPEPFLYAYPFDRHIRRLIHVPGLRGNPERTYKTTAIGSEFPGTFENYVASVVNHWQSTRDPRLKDLGQVLETLGLTWKVAAKQVDDIQVELRVGRLPRSARGGAMDMVSIADVGFGVSQVLPVLVALLVAEPGQLVYLEQPEIHLHPRAQVALAQMLANAANRGVQVIAETHSAQLLLAVQTLVAEGKLAPNKVKLHWFTRREDGITEVTSADLDKNGAFGDWPEDFAEVALATESRYLDAAEIHQS